jgi:predicted SnoaL-like aldol condensation-catalyzing enzyme
MTSTASARPDAGMQTNQQLEQNRRIAVDFLARASDGHAREAWAEYGAPDFVHHNPYFRSDAESLVTAMDENARQNPTKVLEVLRTVAEGPLVAVHSRVRHQVDGPDSALVHLFRIKDGRIHELWDIGQEVPADMPNERGMF